MAHQPDLAWVKEESYSSETINANYLRIVITHCTSSHRVRSTIKLTLVNCLHFSLSLFTFRSRWGRRRRTNEWLCQGGAWSWEVCPAWARPARTWLPQAPWLPHGRLALPSFPEVTGQACRTERRNWLQLGWCWRKLTHEPEGPMEYASDSVITLIPHPSNRPLKNSFLDSKHYFFYNDFFKKLINLIFLRVVLGDWKKW